MTHARIRLAHLLLCAAVLHIAAATGAYLCGRWGLAPGTFDADGVASFASDGRVYRLQLAALESTLGEQGAAAWLRTPAPVHVKLYSLSSALFSPLFGRSVLGVEPLNLLYYLVTLVLVFAVGREAFGAREGLLAAGVAMVAFPSFLLHSTQLLKDPLFVLLGLALVLVSVRWLTARVGLARGLAAGALGGCVAGALWLVKHSAWPVVLAVMALGAGLSVIEQARRRDLRVGNVAGVALMFVIALGVARSVNPYYLPKEYWMPHEAVPAAQVPAAGSAREHQPEGLSERLAARVGRARAAFVELYPDAASNLDAHVRFEGAGDVLLYLPRAVLIGLAAPFPGMWFGAGGQTGSGARLLAGAETLLMYSVLLLALHTLWRRRRETPAWLLVLVALVGVTALGLVVVNVGALYRQRYLFWILFIVAAADSLARWLPRHERSDTD